MKDISTKREEGKSCECLVNCAQSQQKTTCWVDTRLLGTWVSRHPVDSHVLQKIVLFSCYHIKSLFEQAL